MIFLKLQADDLNLDIPAQTIWNCIWRFPKSWGHPSHHPFLIWDFHERNQPFEAIPICQAAIAASAAAEEAGSTAQHVAEVSARAAGVAAGWAVTGPQ